jgi:hypothetical protein
MNRLGGSCKVARMKKSLPLIAIGAALLVPASAGAATVSGSVPKNKGYQVVVVQANGKGAEATIKRNGSFRVKVRAVNGASVHLIRRDGSYYGPVLFGGGGRKVYGTLRGRASINLKRIQVRRGGYGVAILPNRRTMRSAAYTITARNGRPIGAGNYGRVKVGNGTGPLKGYNGVGRDTDLDGIPGVYDVDDNGNLILDNVDRSGRRGKGRAPKKRQVTSATDFKMFSNFKIGGSQTPNANALRFSALTTLVGQLVPTTLTLATQVVGGTSGTLDCMGNDYCREHTASGASYPQVNFAPVAITTPGLVPITTGPTGDAQISPGATPTEIGAGDAFIQRVGATEYPGTLNFVFNTSPALESFQVGTGAVTTLTYQSDGSANHGMDQNNGAQRIQMSQANSKLTLTFWRPQRRALPGESSSSGWVDIGGLTYSIDTPNAPSGSTKSQCSTDAYSGLSTTNTGDTPVQASDGGMLDTAEDAPSNFRNTLSMTIDLTKCFSWGDIPSGTLFKVDLQARSLYGDNAARMIYIRKN